jgi:hypothetical protein
VVTEEPSSEELRIEQLKREAAERKAVEAEASEEEAAQHERRADKAAYLREKLQERVESERKAAEQATEE